MKTTYVISSIIPNATYNEQFLKTLENYAKVNNAVVKLAETAPNFASDSSDEEYVEKLATLAPYLFSGGETISDKLIITPISANINVIDPLLGMDRLASKLGNIIVPFPRHRMRMVARVLKDNKSPRGLWCTGTISDPYYKATKNGVVAAHCHVYGAIVVEVNEDKTFQIRQLTWDGKGFHDMDKYYTPKATKRAIRASAIVLGDSHIPFLDNHAKTVSKELIKLLKPFNVVHHDVMDNCSISHHLEGKFITKSTVKLNLEQEGKVTSDFLQEMLDASPKDSKHLLVASNHHEHLDKYLEEGRYLRDYPNHKLALELALSKANGNNPTKTLLTKFNKLDRVLFAERSDSFKVHGIELLCHGDKAIGSSRPGTPDQSALVYSGKVVTGHTHSAQISSMGSHVVGTMTYLSMPYTDPSAGSQWCHSNVVIYPNGTMANLVFL